MRKSQVLIFIFTLLPGADILAMSAGTTFRGTIQNDKGTIQSPHFGAEYNKSADHVWRFIIREGKLLKLKLTTLKLFYYNDEDFKKCGDLYQLLVNKVVLDCTKYITEDAEGYNPIQYNFYRTSLCSAVECSDYCSRFEIYREFVEIAYYGSDDEPYGRIPSDSIGGFRMTYEYLDCSTDEANSNGRTTTKMTSHQRPAGSSSVSETSPDVTPANEENSAAVMFGSIAGGVVLVIIAVIIFFFVRQTQKKRNSEIEKITPENINERQPEMKQTKTNDSVLYKSSRDGGGEYSLDNPAVVYAVVDKREKKLKKNGRESTLENSNSAGNPAAIYATVDKSQKSRGNSGPDKCANP